MIPNLMLLLSTSHMGNACVALFDEPMRIVMLVYWGDRVTAPPMASSASTSTLRSILTIRPPTQPGLNLFIPEIGPCPNASDLNQEP